MPVANNCRMTCSRAQRRELRRVPFEFRFYSSGYQLLRSGSQHLGQRVCNSVSTGKINNVIRFHGGVSFVGWDAVFQHLFDQIRRQPSNPPNTRFSHNSPHNPQLCSAGPIDCSK